MKALTFCVNGLEIIMTVNAGKFNLLVTGNYKVSANIDEFKIEISKIEKLLVVSIDIRLSFEHHYIAL